ncbi:hypothetical protein [Gloeocapsa sp. PCC 73106]|nr:hypothetical protein [Gloeocapsa sp. PCC 73106]ELS00045.1 hypothetical protein GLO73106DRAFT_00038980 [Gloeocapsa sp. PCC 73106]
MNEARFDPQGLRDRLLAGVLSVEEAIATHQAVINAKSAVL